MDRRKGLGSVRGGRRKRARRGFRRSSHVMLSPGDDSLGCVRTQGRLVWLEELKPPIR